MRSRRPRRSPLTAAWLTTLLVLAAAATARGESLAVVILPGADTDAAFADNLTEVAMARLATTPGRALVGTRELRHRGLPELTDLRRCVEQPPCLSNVAGPLGAQRAVVGVVDTRGDRFQISLALTDLASRQVQRRYAKQVDRSVPAIIASVQAGVDELLRPGPPPTRSLADEEAAPPAARTADVHLGDRVPAPAHPWAAPVAYGCGAGALAALSTGVVFGSLAVVQPSGQTRAEAQMDLQRRKTYGRVGTTLIVSASALTMVSVATFIKYWHQITGN
jgi:hypothetical protein